MKAAFHYAFIFLFLLLNININQAFGLGWTEEERNHADSFTSKIKDPFIITLKTYSEDPAFVLPKNRKTKIRKHFVSSSYFKDGKIPYLLGEVKGDKETRPLAIFIPGTFSKLFSQITKDFHLRLVRLGYRVVSFENLFYHDAIKRGPLFNLFNTEKQAKVYFDAAQRIHTKLLDEGKVNNQVTLLGQSYGGFLASVMFNQETAQLSKKKAHFFNGGLHIYSPPFNFARSIELFDEILLEAKKNKTFGSFPKYVLTHFEINKIDYEFEISEDLRRRALPLFVDYGFKTYMEKTLEAIEKVRVKNILPKMKKEKKEFFKNLSFGEAFSLMDTEAFNHFKRSEEKLLVYWIKKAIQKGRDNIRILTSLDDMINDEVDPELVNSPHMLIIPNGGHFGYRQMPWFDKLLIKSLKLNKTTDLNDLKLALFQTQEDQ